MAKNTKQKKRRKWTKLRHKIVIKTVYPFLSLYVKRKCGVVVEKFNGPKNRPYLILMNHQTGYDQFFTYMAFKGTIYTVATEDIFSMGFVSKLLKFFIAPIPIKKSTHDTGAVMNCLRVAREGASIAIFPEGNRTYSGKTENISPAIAKLARMLKLPIAFMRIEGGYGVQPRWANKVRKGQIRIHVSRIMEIDEVEKLSLEDLHEVIVKELDVNENCSDKNFYSQTSAEYLERAVYVCPFCGIAEFESKEDIIECKKCHRKIRYSQDKKLSGVNCDFPFEYIGDWYDYQSEFMRFLDITPYATTPVFKDGQINLFNVVLYKEKQLFKKGMTLCAFNDRFEVFDKEQKIVLPFEEVTTVTVLGKNKLNVYYQQNEKVYQVKGTKRFNALKYVNLYYHYKNIKTGDEHGKFLGL